MKILFVFIGFIGLLSLIVKNEEEIPSCLQTKASRLLYVDSATSVKLNNCWKSDQIHILHVGDSHIEMGSFSEGIKSAFREKGIVLHEGWSLPPFSSSLNVKSFKNRQKFNLNSIRYQQETNGITGRFLLYSELANKRLIKNDTSQHLVLIKNGYNFSSVKTETISQFHSKGKLSSYKIEAERIYSLKSGNYNITYSNFGVSGARWSHYKNEQLMLNQLEQIPFNILVFTLGTNDSYASDFSSDTLTKRLETVLNIQKRFPTSICIVMTAPDSYYKQQHPPHLLKINEQIHQFCKENALPCWDWYAVMGGAGSMQCIEKSSYRYGDYLHFSKASYHLFGKLFTQALFDSI